VDQTEIDRLKAEIEQLKSVLKTLPTQIHSSVENDIRESERRMTDFLGDRLDSVDKKSQANSTDVGKLKEQLNGDGKDQLGIRDIVKDQEKRLSLLELDKRDRSTVLSFGKAAWGIVGTLIFGLGVTLIKADFDQKARIAENIQSENRRRFEAVETKASKTNTIFYESIGELKEFKRETETNFRWVERMLQK